MRQKKTLRLYQAFMDLCNKDGPTTLRGYFYRMLSRGLIEEDGYGPLKYIKKGGLEDGVLRDNMFLDRSRPSYGDDVWNSLEDFNKILPEAFRLNYWENEPYKVEIWTEKDTLSQVIYESSSVYRVPVRVTRGYNSDTMNHEWGSKDKIILYLGDFDPSGLDMDRKLAKVTSYEIPHRVAITEEQFKKLPSIGIKNSLWAAEHGKTKGDPRAKKFEELYGDRCCELDALPISELQRIVQHSIEKYVTFNLREKQAEEESIRQKLRDILGME